MAAKYKIVQDICSAVGRNAIGDAKAILKEKYPFNVLDNAGRRYSDYQKIKIFLRDGFVDRYSGEKLVFPAVLRLLSELMPEEFPFQKNWKMSECHLAYWHLFPTIDHIVPVSRGGRDEESNWVCTSQLRNSAKSNWLLEELGWELHKPGQLDKWDGLVGWFMDYVDNHPDVIEDNYLCSWYKAVRRVHET